MAFILNDLSISKLLRIGIGAAFAFALTACGGGGGSPGVTSGTSNLSKAGLKLELFDANNFAKNSLSPNAPLTARATVLDASGKPLPNAIVTFTTAGGLANITPSTGSVLTDAAGVATVTLTAVDLAPAKSAGTVTATTTVGTTEFTANMPFSIGMSAIAGITLDLVDSNNVSKSSLTTAGPLTARATVFDITGKPLPNTIVTFTGGNFATIAPASGTALTNSSGVATVVLTITNLATAQAQAGSADVVTATATIGNLVFTAKRPYTIGVPAITLKLVAPSPSTINLNAYATTSIKVNVFADGVLYTAQPVTVNFTSACAGTKADLPASATTINGLAQVVYRDNGCSTTDTVTISSAGAQSITATIVVAAPVAASIGFVSATPSDNAIVIKGSGGTGRTETATLTFKALDTAGQPLPNVIVSFAVNSTQQVFLQATSAITAADGTVTVSVNSGTQPTTFRVVATLPTGQSTISDTITVTTGQPVQAAFSLSAEKYNIEGWSHDNEKTKINILLADQFGNPVADGTPVVFQTDSGAIGSSAVGGCTTLNGGCSVDLRSQDPRFGLGNTAGKRAGLATIDVSSTSALITLSGRIGVFFSGSSAVNAFFAGTNDRVPLSTALSTNSCGTYSLQLELNDVNFNPLPVGTAVVATNADNVTVQEIIPSTVPNIWPRDASGNPTLLVGSLATRQGIPHTIPVKPDDVCVNGSTGFTQTGTFDVKITTPLGSPVVYGFSLTYPVAAPVVPPPVCVAPQVLQGGVCVTPPSPSIVVALSKNAVANAPPVGNNELTASATVRDINGSLVPNTVVTFTLSNTAIAAMTPSTGTALTNASGVATITVSKVGVVVGPLGAVVVTGAATVGGVTVTNTASFAVN